MTDTALTWDNMSLDEIEQSIARKPKWAAEMIRKCFDDKHKIDGNLKSAVQLIDAYRSKIAQLERDIARYRSDLQDCWEAKALLENELAKEEG